MKRILFLLLPSIFVLFLSPNIHAFGMGDVLGAAFKVGTDLGSAAVGMAVDSFRDPAKEDAERQRKEQEMLASFNKEVDKIEAKKELTPLQREQQVMALQGAYSNAIYMKRFVAQVEDRQRAARDQIFTAQGLAGVAADSVAAMPTVINAQADAMVKAGIPQQHTKDVMSRIDNQGNISPTKPNLARAVVGAANLAQAQTTIQDNMEKQGAELNAAVAEAKLEPLPGNLQVASQPVSVTFFSPDIGRKLYVEFKGSQKLTDQFRTQLAKQGHVIVDNRSAADVVYLVEGEYMFPETSQFEGFRLDAGSFYDNPKQPEQPKEKLSGKIKSTIFSGLLLIGQAQAQIKGQPPAQPNIPLPGMALTQSALLVASRQAQGEKEFRISSLQKSEGSAVAAEKLLNTALADLLEKLGVMLN